MMSSSGLWPLEPAQRVGSFSLGMGVNEALAVVQKMGSLDRAEFSFDEAHLFDADLALQLPSMGVHLCFDGFLQDLRVISIALQRSAEDNQGVNGVAPFRIPAIAYGGRVFAGSQQPAISFRDVYAMFGPTWIGDFKTSRPAAYFLRYPGLTFEFPLPDDAAEALAARGEHPMDIPGRSPPCASQLWVYSGESPSFLAPASALPEGPEPAVVRPGLGVELRGRILRFGAMPQDVFSDFGPPEQVCVKSVDTVRIHSTRGAGMPPRLSGADYYYNYFHLGVDVLFDGHTHLVKKVILHANPPTHETFSRYARCFYQIAIRPQDVPSADAGEQSLDLALVCDADVPELADPGPAASPPLAQKPRPDTSQEGVKASPHGLTPAAPSVVSAAALAAAVAGQGAEEEDEVEGAERRPVPARDREPQSEEEGDHEVRLTGRRMSKKERKAAKKGRKKDARAPVGSIGMSPELAALSSSPEPSPLQAALPDVHRLPPSAEEECEHEGLDGWDDLPPSLSTAEEREDGPSEEEPVFNVREGRRGRRSPSDAASTDHGPSSASDLGACPSAPSRGSRHLEALDTLTEVDPSPPVNPHALKPDDALRPEEGGTNGNAGGSFCGGHGSSAAEPGSAAVAAIAAADASDGSKPETSEDAASLTIDVRWPWTKIEGALGMQQFGGCGKPLVVSHCGGHTPFGSTYFYALPGLAFEVMQNDYIASVTLFSVPREELPIALFPAGEPAPPARTPGK